MKKYYTLFIIIMYSNCLNAQAIYFPPLTGSAWDTVSPSSLGWCQNYLDTLDNMLQQKNTKAIIILKDGKIAHETYFGTFTADSMWYWASAGKSLTSFCTGMAIEQSYLSINDSTSKYLGTGWTSCTASQEGLITIRNQLTMTTGLDDGVANSDCTSPSCLQYIADAGTRWAYHNAPYTLLHEVINAATGNFTNFFNTQVRNRIGMDGLWINNNIYNRVYYSRPRSMARFGLLMLNHGIWNADTLMHDQLFYQDMISTSQNLNLSYGFLWWLNGKSSFMLPGVQFVFSGDIIPAAPADMFCALGKNDQKLHVVPSQNLVVVRMGNPADSTSLVPLTLDNEMWIILNKVFCNATSSQTISLQPAELIVYPNPFSAEINTEQNGIKSNVEIVVTDVYGREMTCCNSMLKNVNTKTKINTTAWKPGIYFLKSDNRTLKLIKQ